MFVVIFHMLYLLGKYVYDNYHVKKASAPSKDAADGETSDRQHVNDNKVQAEVDETQPVPLAELSQTVKFSPPVYIQRYLAVSNVLSDPKYEKKLRKVNRSFITCIYYHYKYNRFQLFYAVSAKFF